MLIVGGPTLSICIKQHRVPGKEYIYLINQDKNKNTCSDHADMKSHPEYISLQFGYIYFNFKLGRLTVRWVHISTDQKFANR
jgi:hypothetical protein